MCDQMFSNQEAPGSSANSTIMVVFPSSSLDLGLRLLWLLPIQGRRANSMDSTARTEFFSNIDSVPSNEVEAKSSNRKRTRERQNGGKKKEKKKLQEGIGFAELNPSTNSDQTQEANESTESTIHAYACNKCDKSFALLRGLHRTCPIVTGMDRLRARRAIKHPDLNGSCIVTSEVTTAMNLRVFLAHGVT